MKKFLAIILCVLVIVAAAGGCSDRSNREENNNSAAGGASQAGNGNSTSGNENRTENPEATPGNEQEDEQDGGHEFDPDAYKVPAEVVSINTNAEDPTNEEIRFVYDEEGRISQCYYAIDGEEVYVGYNYQDGAVQIYAFMGEFLVGAEKIELPEYDASVGFTAVNGYYLKGYKF